MEALLNGWQQRCDALHPDHHLTLLEALRDTYLAAAHTVTQFARNAEGMEYPQFRAWLLRMAAMAAERRAYETLLEPIHLSEQADPDMAEGFRRLRAAKQQHHEALLDMLVKSDPYTLARDPAFDPERLHLTDRESPRGDAPGGATARDHV
jgi:hypothetical protein